MRRNRRLSYEYTLPSAVETAPPVDTSAVLPFVENIQQSQAFHLLECAGPRTLEDANQRFVCLTSRCVLHRRIKIANPAASDALRLRRGTSTPNDPDRLVFNNTAPMPPAMQRAIGRIAVPWFFCPHLNSLEPVAHYRPYMGEVVAGDYEVDGLIGRGAFASVYRATSLEHNVRVGLKIMRNDKDCLDAGLGEVRIYAIIHRALHGDAERDADQHVPSSGGGGGDLSSDDAATAALSEWQREAGRGHLLRLLDCFYFREHLVLVTELVGCSLLRHYTHVRTAVSTTRARPSRSPSRTPLVSPADYLPLIAHH